MNVINVTSATLSDFKIKSCLLIILVMALFFSCSKEEGLDIKPFNRIVDDETNDTFDRLSKAKADDVLVGFFHNKEDGGDRDHYEVSFSDIGTSYEVIQTAVPGIDSKISFFTSDFRYLFSLDERGTGEAEKLWNFSPKSDKMIIVVEAKTGYNEAVPYIINFVSKKPDSKEEVEPNNSEKEAVEIRLKQTKKGYITPKNDVDYFKISSDDDKIYDFSVEVETLSNLDINFMIINKRDNSSKFINFSSWGGSESMLYLSSDKGDYYLRISGNVNSDNRKDPLYYLSIKEHINESDTPLHYEREFNDSPEQATGLIFKEEMEGILLPDDSDWFKFELLEEASSLDISLSRYSGDSALITILNSDLEVVKEKSGSSSLSIRDVERGRYFIKLSQKEKGQAVYRLFLNAKYK